jgi:hypothetical protein
MAELNASIRDIPLPVRMARRPVSRKGFPVPWFVSWIDGDWDFVNVDPRKMVEAHRRRLCWLCGEALGQYRAFVIGPMCAINRTTAEPPSHRECAEYAVRACPFLVNPNMRRNLAATIDPTGSTVPGIMLEHNPGSIVIWITKTYRIRDGLFMLGEPVNVSWFAKGRTATRAEIDASIAKGLPYLRRVAEMQSGGVEALEQQIKRALPLLPAA